jgi:3-deoxy-D-manno-octulosonic acid kinase
VGVQHVPTRLGDPGERPQGPGIGGGRPWKRNHRYAEVRRLDGETRPLERRHGLSNARNVDECLYKEANLVACRPPFLAGLYVKHTNGGSVFHSGGKLCLSDRAGQRSSRFAWDVAVPIAATHLENMYLPPADWIRDRFDVVQTRDVAAFVRTDFREIFDRHELLGCPAGRVARDTDLSGGRGAAWVLSTRSFGDLVVRPYRRGGWISHLVKRRYLAGARAFHELLVTERLHRLGAPVPEVLAAVQARIRPGPGYSACIVTRRITGTVPSAEALASTPEGQVRVLMEDIGRAIRTCHEAGGWHADLNAWNLLVPKSRPDLPVMVIDWDRGRWTGDGVPDRARRANLSRLARSLRKLELASAIQAWPALESGYASEPGPAPAA